MVGEGPARYSRGLMNATVTPFASLVPPDNVRLSGVEWPGGAPLRLARIEELPPATVEPVQPQERHVAAWRASLGHAYAEWAGRMSGTP